MYRQISISISKSWFEEFLMIYGIIFLFFWKSILVCKYSLKLGMNKTTCSQGQHNSLALKRIFKSSSKLIRCSEKKWRINRDNLSYTMKSRHLKKKFLKGRSTFFKAWWVIIGLQNQKGSEERKNKNKFNSMKSCVLFYDSPKVLYLLVIFYSCFYSNFKANFVIMVSELWCTLEQVLCTYSMGAKSF